MQPLPSVLILAKGTHVDCGLTTKVVNEVSGFAACLVSSNVYSDNGKVLLLERGSKVEGEYVATVQQGQRRLFVLWQRVRTPNGPTIALDSPAADGLGTMGYREQGEPNARVRVLVFETTGLTWKGLPIVRIEYRQTYSVPENIVYHAAISYTFASSYSELMKPITAMWRRERLQPEHNPVAGGFYVTRSAITQSVRQAKGQALFVSEFNE